jgi:hypothetical protein
MVTILSGNFLVVKYLKYGIEPNLMVDQFTFLSTSVERKNYVCQRFKLLTNQLRFFQTSRKKAVREGSSHRASSTGVSQEFENPNFT